MTVVDSVKADTARAEALAGPARVKDYVDLLKPRVMSLVIFTAFVGMAIAPGSIHPVIGFTAILAIAVGAGGSAALNMWYDADIDGRMTRTRSRPLPMGRMDPSEALALGLVLSAASVVTMAVSVNYVAALLLAGTIAFYILVYTMWLKRRTAQNIVIGGAAGAFPPMIGWIAVTGTVTWEPIVLFLIIFIWTPPHFWALSLYRAGDYAKVGVPMMPVVAGKASTRWQILLYTVVLVPITAMPAIAGWAGPIYAAIAAVTGAIFLWMTLRLAIWGRDHDQARDKGGLSRTDRMARGVFAYSILYLFLIFGGLLIDSLWTVGG